MKVHHHFFDFLSVSKKSIKNFLMLLLSIVHHFTRFANKMEGWNFFRMSKRNGDGSTMDMSMPSSSSAIDSSSSNILGQAGNSVIRRLGWKQGKNFYWKYC